MSSKTRVRTRRTNGQPPLRLSTIKPEHLSLRDSEKMTMVCQECGSWRRILGATTLKVIPHEGTEYGHGKPEERCAGGNQIVIVDIDIRKWQRRQDHLVREAMPAENRRAARQFHKPLPAPATPLHRIATMDTKTAKTAYRAYSSHRDGCATCVGRAHCDDGERLARHYVSLLGRGQVRELLRELVGARAAVALRQPVQPPRDRRAEWMKVLPAVELADAQRAAGAGVPLVTLHSQSPAH